MARTVRCDNCKRPLFFSAFITDEQDMPIAFCECGADSLPLREVKWRELRKKVAQTRKSLKRSASPRSPA